MSLSLSLGTLFASHRTNVNWELRSSSKSQAVKLVCQEKQAFLDQFAGVYGYSDTAWPINKLRASEFPRLNGTVPAIPSLCGSVINQ